MFSSLFSYNLFFDNIDKDSLNVIEKENIENFYPNPSVNVSLLQDPFSSKIIDLRDLVNNSKSDLEVNRTIYNRYAGNVGNTDTSAYSEENLLVLIPFFLCG